MVTDLAFALDPAEYFVEVVTSRQQVDNADANLPPAEILNDIRINRVWTTCWGRANLLGRAIDYLSFYLSASFFVLWNARSGNLLVAKTDPPLIGVPIAMVAWLRGAKLVNWWQDVYPEVAERLGVRAIRPVSGLMRWLRRKTCEAAEQNVVIGRCMQEFLVNTGAPADNVTVIPNWTNDQVITPLIPENNALRIDWGLADAFVVGYSGNMGRGHDFEALLEAAESFLADTRVRFLFIGSGARKQEIQDEAASRGLSNILFRPFQPRDQLAKSLTVPDVHIVSLRPGMCGLIVPSKFYGALAAGRPLIFLGPEESEIARVIDEYDCGFVCSETSPDRLTKIIRDFIETDRLARQQGARARQAIDERYSKARSINAWKKVIDKAFD